MQSTKVRQANFAGSWYPAGAAECEKEINSFLSAEGISAPAASGLVGGIVPHAGWYFSGSIACNVIRYLKESDPFDPDVIVVFGMHLAPSAACIMMTEGTWQTPFGDIPVAVDMAAELARRFRFEVETPSRFTPDNTIELQLPFIKYFFSEARIVAMGVPPNTSSLEIGRAVADVSSHLGLKVKVIGSTDLTHYGDNYGFVSKGTGISAVTWVKEENDRRVIEAMLALDPEKVITEARDNQNACCAGAAATAIASGKHLGASQAETIAYTTSYDKSPGDSFVGYVGIVF